MENKDLLSRNRPVKSKFCCIIVDLLPQEFKRGTARHFIMTTEEDLGALMYLRVWHDNSGHFSKASWYLQKIVVEDVETEEK